VCVGGFELLGIVSLGVLIGDGDFQMICVTSLDLV
jgi:hypothetical protein